MKNYENLGLSNQLDSLTSLRNRRRDVNPAERFDPQSLVYYQVKNPGRDISAVVALSKAGGAFTDFQDAFDYVNSLGGGRILVMPGTYTISSNLTIYNDTYLEGLSTNDCVVDFNSGTNNLSTIGTARDVTITNLTFQNCQNTTTGCIYLNSADRTHIKKCRFSSNRTAGSVGYDIYGTAPSGCLITECASTDAATFYYAESSAGINEVSFNSISNAVSSAILGGTSGNGGGQTVYRGNLFQGCVKSLFSGIFNYSFITDNFHVAQGSLTATALDFNNSDYMSISNNFIQADTSTQPCMDLDNCDYNKFTNNHFTGRSSGTPAIQLGTCTQTIFTGNIIDTGGMGTNCDGMQLVNADNTVITGNWIQGGNVATSYAIDITDTTSSSNVLVGNWLTAVTGDVNDGGTFTINANNR